MSRKIKDQEKRCERLEREYENAKEKLVEQEERVKNKEVELQGAKVDLVNLLLIENDISLEELPAVLSEHKKKEVKVNNQTSEPFNKEDTHLN